MGDVGWRESYCDRLEVVGSHLAALADEAEAQGEPEVERRIEVARVAVIETLKLLGRYSEPKGGA